MKKAIKEKISINKEMIRELTNDFYDGTGFVLLMLMEDKDLTMLETLKDLGITGKRIDTLYNVCCHRDLNLTKETICFLFFEDIAREDIVGNLDSEHPIPFIKQIISDYGNNYEEAHHFYAKKFYKEFNKTKSIKGR